MRIMMLVLGIGCAGCSFATVHGSTTPSPGEPACTQRYTAPAVDTGWVVGNLAGMAIFNAITSRGGGSDQQKTVSTAYFATAGALSGLFLISAIYGYAAVARCNRFEEAALWHRERARAKIAPPSFDAAGFHLGSSPGEAREACATAGRVWADVDGGATCSGLAKGPIAAQTTRLFFTATRLVVVEADVRPAGEGVETWSGAFRALQHTLKEWYGTPSEKSLDLPDECKPSAVFMRCLADGKIKGITRWNLFTGTSVALIVAPENGAGVIRVRFSLPGA